MLTCIPQALCSWNFRIEGGKAGPASLTFNFFSEHGSISLAGEEYLVEKQGWLSGRWILERDGQPIAEAQKPSPILRSFEIHQDAVQISVAAISMFSRQFEILSGSERAGTIFPAHPFTRRAFIDCDPSVPELAQLFAFWLVVLTWRRRARSSNHHHPG